MSVPDGPVTPAEAPTLREAYFQARREAYFQAQTRFVLSELDGALGVALHHEDWSYRVRGAVAQEILAGATRILLRLERFSKTDQAQAPIDDPSELR